LSQPRTHWSRFYADKVVAGFSPHKKPGHKHTTSHHSPRKPQQGGLEQGVEHKGLALLSAASHSLVALFCFLFVFFFFFFQPRTIGLFCTSLPTTSHPQASPTKTTKPATAASKGLSKGLKKSKGGWEQGGWEQGVGLAFSRISPASHALVALFAN
jgi:hypothetical protein